MAFSSGNFASTAAGSLIALLDVLLPANAYWSIYDAAAAANCKVYRCYDAAGNCDFYLRVDDNYDAYAILQLWEGWDADGHAGTGARVTSPGSSGGIRYYRPASAYGISVHDHYFKAYNGYFEGHYIGQPRRYNAAKNIVLIIACGNANTNHHNPIGYGSSQTASNTIAVWEALLDETGAPAHVMVPGGGGLYQQIKTETGAMEVLEARVLNNGRTDLLIGILEGITNHTSSTLPGFLNGETVNIDGVDWMAIGGNYSTKYWSLFKLD